MVINEFLKTINKGIDIPREMEKTTQGNEITQVVSTD